MTQVLKDPILKSLCLFRKRSVRTKEEIEYRGVCFGLFFQVVLIDKSISQDTLNIPDSTPYAFPCSVFGRSSVRSLFVTGKFRIKVQTACFAPGVKVQVITAHFSSDPSFFLTVRYRFAPFLGERKKAFWE